MKNIIAAFIILILCSCEGLLHFVDSKKCINEEIEAFQKEMEDTCDSGAEIIKYEFQDEIVYAFYVGSCISDGGTKVLDEDCNEICLLGTIVGITDCRDEPFENAKELKIIWQQ